MVLGLGVKSGIVTQSKVRFIYLTIYPGSTVQRDSHLLVAPITSILSWESQPTPS